MVHLYFNRDVLKTLELESSRIWPRPGNLRVDFSVTTPLYFTMARNSEALALNRRAILAGEKVAVVNPDCDAADDLVLWSLEPTQDPNNWRGYFPKVFQIVEAKNRRIEVIQAKD